MKHVLICVLAIFACLPAAAQQGDTNINRYTIYTGFDYMLSPARNLTQRGFDVDFGVTAKPWLGLGGDFSASGNGIISGGGTINGSETVYAPKLTAANALMPFVPLPNSIYVPFKSTTYTFAVGPQIYIRRFKQVTFLIRPGLGGIHESANLTLPPALGQLFPLLQIPVPASHQTDTTYFLGLGGGFDLNLSRRVGFRFTADWINTHLFSDLLSNRQNYVRFTVGPTFRWGQLK
ncbi:MAG: hypothetical protein WBL63_17710 [Candidatus Acidiferrum sp.]